VSSGRGSVARANGPHRRHQQRAAELETDSKIQTALRVGSTDGKDLAGMAPKANDRPDVSDPGKQVRNGSKGMEIPEGLPSFLLSFLPSLSSLSLFCLSFFFSIFFFLPPSLAQHSLCSNFLIRTAALLLRHSFCLSAFPAQRNHSVFSSEQSVA